MAANTATSKESPTASFLCECIESNPTAPPGVASSFRAEAGDRVIAGSAAIIDYLEGAHPAPALYPAAAEARQAALKRQVADCEARQSRIAQRLEQAAAERKTAEETLAAAGADDNMSQEVTEAREALTAARDRFDEAEKAKIADLNWRIVAEKPLA